MTNAVRVACALLLAAGVFFRFYMLEDKLLWHDELATRVFAAGYTVDEWHEELFSGEVFDVSQVTHFMRHNPDRSVFLAIRELAEDDPQHPPLYYVLTRVWVTLFGDSTGTLRALGALVSLLGFPAMYWLAWELFDKNRRVAWGSVLLLAVSPFFVLYAQEAREYAMWAVLIIVSNASLLAAIRETESQGRPTRAWALYSLATVLSLYTSFSSAASIITQLVFLVHRERGPTRVAKHAFVALAVAAIAFLPWVIALLHHWEAFQVSMKWSRIINIPRSALLRILGHNTSRVVVDFWSEIDTPAGWAALVAMCAVTIYALAQVRKKRLVVLLVVVPIGMLLVPDLVSGGIRSISMRYLTPAWIAVILALAHLPPKAFVPLLALAFASTAYNAPKVAVWTKSTSVHLVEVADFVNAEERALLVGNMERHNPGNLMALSVRLKEGTKMQFLTTPNEEKYVLRRDHGTVFLFTPIGEYREAMQKRENVTSEKLIEDHFLDLWRVRY